MNSTTSLQLHKKHLLLFSNLVCSTNYLSTANLFHREVLVYIAQNLSYLEDRVVYLCGYRREHLLIISFLGSVEENLTHKSIKPFFVKVAYMVQTRFSKHASSPKHEGKSVHLINN